MLETKVIPEFYNRDAQGLPLAESLRRRLDNRCAEARGMHRWSRQLVARWSGLHIGNPALTKAETGAQVVVPVYLGEIDPMAVQVEMFAEDVDGSPSDIVIMHRQGAIPGSMNGYLYAGTTISSRPLEDYTARVVPYYPGVHLPTEMPLIAWQK